MNLELTSSCLTHVNKSTEMTFDDVYEAYQQADNFTMLGFEVDGPKSLDGVTHTIVITQ